MTRHWSALRACAAALVAAAVVAPAASADVSARLEADGFVVVPGGAPDIQAAYDEAAAAGRPAIVTSDCALDITRTVLEEALLRVEDGPLYDRLTDLTRALVRISEEQYLGASDPSAREAARRNIAFFAVPLSLLDPDYFPSESARGLVERELALIEQGEGVTLSPIMGSTPLDGVVGPGEDYSAYVARGRAADDERLARFHRAVTWYSRMAFALPEGRVLDYGLTMQALLAALAIESEAGEWLELWERVYDPLHFFLGGSGDPTIEDYAQIAADVFGDEFDVDDVADVERLAAFTELVGEVAPPHFETHELRGMRFLARPTLPDTRYFVRLSGPADSRLPSGLDLAGLLGSSWARGALEERDAFAGELYRRGFEDIRQELEAMTYGEWTSDIATSWLYALEALAEAPPPGSAAFATSPAWGAKQASTIAAGWALVRRPPTGFTRAAGGAAAAPDTAGAGARGTEGGDAATPIVEPCPLLYGRLRELVEHTRDRLWENYLLDDRLESMLAEHRDFLTALESEAEDASGGGAGRQDARGLAAPSSHARALAGGRRGGQGGAFLAPVFADLVSGRVLWAGVGRPDAVRVLVRGDAGGAVYEGAVFSYYELESVEDAGAAPAEGEWPPRPGAGGTPDPMPRPWWLVDLVGENDPTGTPR